MAARKRAASPRKKAPAKTKAPAKKRTRAPRAKKPPPMFAGKGMFARAGNAVINNTKNAGIIRNIGRAVGALTGASLGVTAAGLTEIPPGAAGRGGRLLQGARRALFGGIGAAAGGLYGDVYGEGVQTVGGAVGRRLAPLGRGIASLGSRLFR